MQPICQGWTVEWELMTLINPRQTLNGPAYPRSKLAKIVCELVGAHIWQDCSQFASVPTFEESRSYINIFFNRVSIWKSKLHQHEHRSTAVPKMLKLLSCWLLIQSQSIRFKRTKVMRPWQFNKYEFVKYPLELLVVNGCNHHPYNVPSSIRISINLNFCLNDRKNGALVDF